MIKNPKIVGAIYDFAGYLTTRPTAFKVGGNITVYKIHEHLKQWASNRELSLHDADVKNWNIDDQELRNKYESLQLAYEEILKANEKYFLIRKIITGDD